MDSAYQLAVSLYSQSLAGKAKRLLLKIASLDPSHSPAHNALGVIALDEGDLAAARAYVQRAIELDPLSYKACNTMGNILLQQGSFDESIEMFRSAISLNPDFAEAYANLGRTLQRNGSYAEAVVALQKAAEIRNDFWPFHYELGLALAADQRYVEAEISFRKVLALDPGSHKACSELGKCLTKRGQFKEAEKWCRRALEISPGYVYALNNLGLIYMEECMFELSLKQFREAVAVDPLFDAAWSNIGLVLAKMGRPHEALEVLDRITAVGRDSSTALANMGYCLVHCGKPDEAVLTLRKALDMDPGMEAVHSGLLLAMNYSSNFSADDIFQESCRWDHSFCSGVTTVPAFPNIPNKDRRLRIGYVSPDFRVHSVSFFCPSLFEWHDRSEVEVFCYSNVSQPDEMTHRIKRLADVWRNVYGLADAAFADLIREDRIDILVDLAGHTSGNRLRAFALKPAPIQVTWLGYPGTSGLSAIDYRITDAIADPEGQADSVHVEQLVRLSHGFLCYTPPADAPEVALSPVERNGYVTFGSFNRSAKISPKIANTWGEILRRVPHSRLVIKQMNFREQGSLEIFISFLRNAGISLERIITLPYMASVAEHLGMYNSIDISLDTFPYNGTTTTCESLWMGVPVVTLLGDRHASRVGASILAGLGMNEFVADSESNYVDAAVMLANDRERLRDLRYSLRRRIQASPLVDAKLFSRQMEEAYRRMWHKWCLK